MPALLRGGLEAMVAFGLPIGLFLRSPLGRQSDAVIFPSLKLKLTELLSPVLNYYILLDVATAAVVALALAVLVVQRTPRKRLLDRSIALSIAMLILLFLIAPLGAKGGFFLDVRFFLMAVFLLFAGVDFAGTRLVTGLSVGTLFSLILVTRTLLIADVWYRHDHYDASLWRLLSTIPPKSKVLVLRADPQLNPGWWHQVPPGRRIVGFGSADENLPVLLLVERRAFSPLVFSDPAQQPIRVRQPYQALAAGVGEPPDYHILADRQLPASEIAKFPYLAHWSEDFDFVLIMNSDGAPALPALLESGRMAKELQIQGRTEIATLLRICGASTGRNARTCNTR
jgi:hypothetical protein